MIETPQTAAPAESPVRSERRALSTLRQLTFGAQIRRRAVIPILVAVVVYAQIEDSGFLTWGSVKDMLAQNAGLGIIAAGLTLVMIAGGIDVSVGMIYPVGSVVYAKMALHETLLVAGIIAVAVGLVLGLLNGLLVTKLKFHPFITTLGTGTLFGGAAVMYGGLNGVTPPQSDFSNLGNNTLGGLPYVVLILAVVFVVTAIQLHSTAFGRSLYVIGGNREVARQAGVRSDLYRTLTYVVSGGLAALAGLLFASQSGIGQATSGGQTLSLTAVAVVVLGGTSLYGGQGAMWRTAVGFLILSSITTLFTVLGIGADVQDIVEGSVVVIALLLDAASRRQRV